MAYRLVLGLGNPGSEYAETRHNVGFNVLDRLIQTEQLDWREEARGPAVVAKSGGQVFVKPMTYMNCSGEVARLWMDWLKISAEELVVIVDDVTLPLGQLRIREEGSHGGHNGLRSIEQCLGTSRYARIRCGVGPLPERWSLEGFVLARFTSEEKAQVREMVEAAVAAFHCCQRESVSLAMQVFNTKLTEMKKELE